MSNSDILKAIKELACRFTSLEHNIKKNTADIVTIKDNVEGMDHQMKIVNDKVHAVNRRISEQELKIEETERYSWRWNLKLFNLPETINETTQDARKQVFEILAQIAPDGKK